MTDLKLANFRTSEGTSKRRYGDRLEDYWLDSREFGTVGNGLVDDGPALQATFDAAWGAFADPHGSHQFGVPTGEYGGNEIYTNRAVHIPPGDYMTNQTLCLNLVCGGVLLGDSSYTTRIFFNPEAPPHLPAECLDTYPDPPGNTTALLEARMCWNLRMEGLTLDASGVQDNAMRVLSWPPTEGSLTVADGDDGSQGYYRDMHFTNAINGVLVAGDEMGSERLWVTCRYTNCTRAGHNLAQANALNHNWYNCLIANNPGTATPGQRAGLLQTTGGSGTVWFCRFENNSPWDVDHTQSHLWFAGNYSNSTNFANADGLFVANRHTGTGKFWQGLTGTQLCVCKSNSVPDAIIEGYATSRHLVGNDFGNPNYLDTATGSIHVDDDGT